MAISVENEILLSIIEDVRTALGTPENVGLGQHARQVVAEAQRAREDLTQAVAALSETADAFEQVQEDYDTTFALLQAADVQSKAYCDGMEQLARFVNAVTRVTAAPTDATGDKFLDYLRNIMADAEKWRAVPWAVISSIIFDWELTNDIDDDMRDLRTWYDRSKPEEVQV